MLGVLQAVGCGELESQRHSAAEVAIARFVEALVFTSFKGLADRADGGVLCAISERFVSVAQAYEALGASMALAPKLHARLARRAWNV